MSLSAPQTRTLQSSGAATSRSCRRWGTWDQTNPAVASGRSTCKSQRGGQQCGKGRCGEATGTPVHLPAALFLGAHWVRNLGFRLPQLPPMGHEGSNTFAWLLAVQQLLAGGRRGGGSGGSRCASGEGHTMAGRASAGSKPGRAAQLRAHVASCASGSEPQTSGSGHVGSNTPVCFL